MFTPALELKYRRKDFILEPDPSPDSVDSLGIEDARVTFTEDKFYLWYCGYNGKDGLACCAESSDLLNWTKHNPLKGNINGTGNKDHVLFPEKIGNKWWLLHRPWGSGLKSADDYVVRLASADALDGEWTDEGILFRGIKSPEQKFSWVGGGAPPLPLGNGKYLLLYHTGCFFQNDYRRYDGACCLIDFEKYEKGHVENMISHRLEPFMVPETPEECNQKLRIDIVFPMSAHLYQEKLYFLYGAGDKATCGASVEWKEIAGLLGQ